MLKHARAALTLVTCAWRLHQEPPGKETATRPGERSHLANEATGVRICGFEQDVGRLEVSVDDPQGVQVVHAGGDVYQASIHTFEVGLPIGQREAPPLHDGSVQVPPEATAHPSASRILAGHEMRGHMQQRQPVPLQNGCAQMSRALHGKEHLA